MHLGDRVVRAWGTARLKQTAAVCVDTPKSSWERTRGRAKQASQLKQQGGGLCILPDAHLRVHCTAVCQVQAVHTCLVKDPSECRGAAAKLKPATHVKVRHILCEKQSKALEALDKIKGGEQFATVLRLPVSFHFTRSFFLSQ